MSFPNPLSWAVDRVTDFIGSAAGSAFDMVVTGLMGWVMDAVIWVVGGVFNFFLDAQDPNVEADWFVGGDGPYATTAALGATLMVGFLLAGITQGAITGDVGSMLRRFAVDLPVSVLGIVGLISFTQVLVRITDELSTHVMESFEEDVADFNAVLASVSLSGVASFAVLVVGIATILAGIILVAELAVRSALVYIVVALAPLVFAARLWPALQGVARKLLELLVALVVSKLVIAIALAVAASAAVGSGSGGEVTALPAPETFAEDPGGSVTQAVGILLAATAAFGVAAFSPLLVTKLLPITEAAVVAQGIRSGPVRAAQQALSTAYSADMLSNGRLRSLASGRGPHDHGAGGRQGAAGGGGADGPAAAIAAAKVAKDAARRGAGTAQRMADTRWSRDVENHDDPARPRGRKVDNVDSPSPPLPGSRPVATQESKPPEQQPPEGGAARGG